MHLLLDIIQCWLQVLWYSVESNFSASAKLLMCTDFESYSLKSIWCAPRANELTNLLLVPHIYVSEPKLTYCQLDPNEHISVKFYLKFKYFHSRKCVWTCRLRIVGHFVQGKRVNTLWRSDAIRWQGTESTLAQVMACCLTASSHYLNQCWLIISKVLCHSSEGIIMRRSEDTNP